MQSALLYVDFAVGDLCTQEQARPRTQARPLHATPRLLSQELSWPRVLDRFMPGAFFSCSLVISCRCGQGRGAQGSEFEPMGQLHTCAPVTHTMLHLEGRGLHLPATTTPQAKGHCPQPAAPPQTRCSRSVRRRPCLPPPGCAQSPSPACRPGTAGGSEG